MIGVIIVTHADFGLSLYKAAEGIVGRQDQCLTISVTTDHEMNAIFETLEEGIKKVDSGQGVIILTDMFGGTPSNVSLSFLGTRRLEVVTGVNLPLLLKIFGNRELPLDDLARQARSAGQQGILVAGEVLKRKVADGQS